MRSLRRQNNKTKRISKASEERRLRNTIFSLKEFPLEILPIRNPEYLNTAYYYRKVQGWKYNWRFNGYENGKKEKLA